MNLIASADAIIHGIGNRQNSKNVLKACVYNNLLEFQDFEKCHTRASLSISKSRSLETEMEVRRSIQPVEDIEQSEMPRTIHT